DDQGRSDARRRGVALSLSAAKAGWGHVQPYAERAAARLRKALGAAAGGIYHARWAYAEFQAAVCERHPARSRLHVLARRRRNQPAVTVRSRRYGEEKKGAVVGATEGTWEPSPPLAETRGCDPSRRRPPGHARPLRRVASRYRRGIAVVTALVTLIGG